MPLSIVTENFNPAGRISDDLLADHVSFAAESATAIAGAASLLETHLEGRAMPVESGTLHLIVAQAHALYLRLDEIAGYHRRMQAESEQKQASSSEHATPVRTIRDMGASRRESGDGVA